VVKVSLALLAVIVDCHDPRRQAEWWAHALAYKVSQRNPDEFLISDPAGVGATRPCSRARPAARAESVSGSGTS
jgi:hypothetical protein